ncbi:MAG: hypothetical protein CMM90_01170 [Rickettsiales bacterium]|nr:hypothetical protein [Rickettsiales bacterium]
MNKKDSQIDWIGDIPMQWKLIKGKYVFNSQKEINKNLKCTNLLSLTYYGVLNKDFTGSGGLRPKDYETYQIFQKDDLVFKMIDLENIKTSRVGIVHEEGIMSSAYIRQIPLKEKINSKFAYWFYYDLYKKEIFNAIGSGVRSTLSSSDLLEIILPIPPLEEQKLISRYLDKKTKQIDRLVEKIQKKIELLNEQRTSLINQCVTKGLDPNVEMKDSGVEWIGEIPNHWMIRRLAVLGWFSKGKNVTKSDLTEYGEPVILYSHLYTTYGRVVKSPIFRISSDKALKATKISNGMFLFTSSGETVDDIGKTLLYSGDCDISVGGDLVIFCMKSREDNYPGFFSFLFNSDFCQKQKSSMSRGEIVVHIYEKQLRELKVFVPPISEQVKITKKLERFDKNNQSLIDNYNKKINILKEYRQSLISSVVTGKVRLTEDML